MFTFTQYFYLNRLVIPRKPIIDLGDLELNSPTRVDLPLNLFFLQADVLVGLSSQPASLQHAHIVAHIFPAVGPPFQTATMVGLSALRLAKVLMVEFGIEPRFALFTPAHAIKETFIAEMDNFEDSLASMLLTRPAEK